MSDIQPYMRDCYKQAFDATVKSVKDGKFVVLDKTYFYPESGGQPFDTGTLTTDDGKEVRVIYVGKFGGNVSHQVEPEGVLEEGDRVHGAIDWERRYKHMRMHTAAHLVSYVFEHEEDAKVTGNKLGEEQSRIDYALDDYDTDRLAKYEDDVNELIQKRMDVTSHFVTREEAEERLERLSTLDVGFPEHIEEVRLLEIGDVDIQACGGTHVENTEEIGTVRFVNFKNKGRENRRVYYELE